MTPPAFTPPLPLSTTPFLPPSLSPPPSQCLVHARPILQASLPTPTPRPDPFAAARDFLSSIRRAAGFGPAPSEQTFDMDRSTTQFEGQPPVVLVVGATGKAGRIIVRKLVLRGYNVRVLVRDLYSSTLDLLGTGVSFVKGHLHDYQSLLEATADVDKVICAVGAEEVSLAESVEYQGVANLIRAFHDVRFQDYGRAEATKLVLFNFGNQDHLEKWKRVIPETGQEGARAPRVNFQVTAPNRVAFMGHVFSKYSGTAEIRTVPSRISLKGFSGLILRCIGDGKTYSMVIRTAEGVKNNVEYVASIKSHKNKWQSVRIPLTAFKAYDSGQATRRRDVPPPDRTDIRQMAIQYRKPLQSPEKDDGRFYLSVDYLKAYRTQEETDFVLVSCASVTSRDFSKLDESGLRAAAEGDIAAWKYLAEHRLRQSGLTYCIVRPGTFTDQPGGNKAIMLEQDGDISGAISRADLAEICVNSLLDARACNVTFDAFESMYAPTAQLPKQKVSSMLGRLRPNT